MPDASAAEATEAARPGSAPTEPRPARKRVERQDQVGQNRSLEYFCKALLAPGREPIVAALQARGFSRARLEALLALVVKINATGGNLLLPRPLEAVRREAEAVAARQAHGRACRPMIRAAVQGDEELLRMWARC